MDFSLYDGDGDLTPGTDDAALAPSEELSADAAGNTASVLRFVNEWLCTLSDAIVGSILLEVLKIQDLTPYGCAQLSTDLEYLR